MSYLFTSESVSEGHPDKVADQISDAILDVYLEGDSHSRVAVETMVTTDHVLLAGEVRSRANVSGERIERVVRDVIRDIGYTCSEDKFDADSCKVVNFIHGQSDDIAKGVDRKDEQGAGDQGMMFGYACRETPELMPMPLHLAHRLVLKLSEIRKNTSLMPYLRPDAKSQVTVKYEDDRRTPRGIHTIVISTQHTEDVDRDQIEHDVRNFLIPSVVPRHLTSVEPRLLVNPSGRFVSGGPNADTGLTGRKIIVDSYGGRGAHGGGAFSGKDPSKVDRSAAYAARHVAKNIVAAELADSVEVQIAYAIGEPSPVSVCIDTSGTGVIGDEELAGIVCETFDLRPRAIIDRFRLQRPGYRKTAVYGHFGRSEFTWEALDAVEDLKQRLRACQSV